MDAAAIEEANRLRATLGLQPLPVPGADAPQKTEDASAGDDTLEGRQSQAYDNYRKHLEAEEAKKK